jgi:hypothetical protein
MRFCFNFLKAYDIGKDNGTKGNTRLDTRIHDIHTLKSSGVYLLILNGINCLIASYCELFDSILINSLFVCLSGQVFKTYNMWNLISVSGSDYS